MSESTDLVLADIDGALAAYGTVDRDLEVSTDAMRWSPEKPEKPEAQDWALIEVRVSLGVSEFVAAIDAASRAMERFARAMLPPLGRAMRETAQLVADVYGCSWEDGKLHYHTADATRRARRRCPVCSPLGFQPPCPDGAYYRRRQLARRRRRRR